MSGVNKVILVGNLGADPDARYTASGDPVTTIALATSEKWTDKQTGNKQERTEWHRVVIFGNLADIASRYLKKGSKVYLEGKLKTRKWSDQQGIDRYSTEVVISGFDGQLQMLDSAPSHPADHANNRPGAQPQQQQGYQTQHNAYAQASGGTMRQQTQAMDNYIPF